MIACGASPLTLHHSRSKQTNSLALAARPVIGMVAMYQCMNQSQNARGLDDESRLEQTFVRCNWQALRFSEAKELFLNATDVDLFGKKAATRRPASP